MDGVMNPFDDWDPDKEWQKLGIPIKSLDEMKPEDRERLIKIIYRMAPRCVKVLNEITDQTGAEIVISSCWRKGRGLDFFDGRGVTGKIIDKTPIIDNAQRGEEIAAWLKANPGHTRFVIIDDDNDMEPLMDHFVQTDNEEGLTEAYLETILKKLA